MWPWDARKQLLIIKNKKHRSLVTHSVVAAKADDMQRRRAATHERVSCGQTS